MGDWEGWEKYKSQAILKIERHLEKVREGVEWGAVGDIDMPPYVRFQVSAAVRGLWDIINFEIMDGLKGVLHVKTVSSAQTKLQERSHGPGTHKLCGVTWFSRPIAFFRYHTMPFNKSIWGRLKDPKWVAITIAGAIPFYSLQVWCPLL